MRVAGVGCLDYPRPDTRFTECGLLALLLPREAATSLSTRVRGPVLDPGAPAVWQVANAPLSPRLARGLYPPPQGVSDNGSLLSRIPQGPGSRDEGQRTGMDSSGLRPYPTPFKGLDEV